MVVTGPALRSLLRDPLLHFVAIGAALFGFFAVVDNDAQDQSRRIVIPAEEIASLAQAMSMLYGQPPSEAEIYQLVEPQIREEVLYREALALGLDDNDSQIRQRLVEKMTFLTEDLIPAQPPTDTELAEFVAENPEAFVEPARVTFDQIYFSPSQHGDALDSVAAAAVAALTVEGDPAAVGDSSTLPARFEDVSAAELGAELGEPFARTVFDYAADGSWRGPLRSVFGAHIVRVTARSEAWRPPLEAMRERVVAAYNNDRRQRANEAAYRTLRDEYDIVVEIPDTVRNLWQAE
jgi:hypothetical protein